jgi:hypothetical protein
MLEVRESACHERVLLLRGRSHREEARRLVDDQEVRVLEEDFEAAPDATALRTVRVVRERRVLGHVEAGLVAGNASGIDAPGADRVARRASRETESTGDEEIEPHRRGVAGMRISMKKSGSPIRGFGPAPGP